MDDGQDADLVRADLVQDPISEDEYLSNGRVVDLGDDTAPLRELGEGLGHGVDRVDDPLRRGGGVLCDVVDDLGQAIERSPRPDYFARPTSHRSRSSFIAASWGIIFPASTSAKPR